MFPNLIEDLTDGTADHDFNLLFTDKRRSTRKDTASTNELPSFLIIDQTENGKGQNSFLNSLARIDRTVKDADGNEQIASVYFVARNPLKVATDAQMLEITKELVDFLNTGTNAQQLLNGES